MAIETMVRSYTSQKRYESDANGLSKQGWSVQSTTERRPRAGCIRLLLLWWWVLIFPPKPEIVVTYVRERR